MENKLFVLSSLQNIEIVQWVLLLLFGLVFFFLVPYSKTVSEFFEAKSSSGKVPGVFVLTTSLVISWIFAKSITNCSNLALSFGYIGGLAYSVYYLSFVVGGVIIYQLRTKGGYKSIHEFLNTKFGKAGVIIFSLLIAIRLFNEVWSNTMVIGSYFGSVGSGPYYMAVIVFTLLTLFYSLKGGLRSSLLTDTIQFVFFAVLLMLVLSWILPDPEFTMPKVVASSDWSWAMGGNLMLAAFLQIFSYPFHDPVLTDRGFISDAKTTLRSYLWAGVIGFTLIFLFGLIGVYGGIKSVEGQAAVEVAKIIGAGSMLVMNFIMITSAASTLDSTFSSFSKLMVVDLGEAKNVSVRKGRFVMISLVIIGTIPVFFNPEILSATTVSGTMVIGLAPIFIFWNTKVPRISYHLSVCFGIFVGVLLAVGLIPDSLILTDGKYSGLLWSNIWGLIGCLLLFFIPKYILNRK